MYAEANKAIYSILEASLLFWTKASKILEEMGYQRHKYNLFIMKKLPMIKNATYSGTLYT